ncbi:MAG: sigma-54-dependent Fis family transcriptional regulator [Deltaproteobacteria bacterium]|nr:sigma-54-dependent Fis family transcriptional regulator [Deltaproteobacteria bacterium]
MEHSTHRPRGHVFIVDDDREMGLFLSEILREAGYTVESYESGCEAVAAIDKTHPDVLITDLMMKQMQGMEVLQEAKRRDADLAVVMITAFGTVETAVEAMRLGAFYYLMKPFDNNDLLLLVERALEERHLRTEVQRLQREVDGHYHFDHIIGKSAAMQHVFTLMSRVKDSQVSVLLTGESGTGKDLIARTLHYQSARKQAHCVAVNCAAIPEHLLESELFGYVSGAFTDARQDKRGLFMEAHGGTLLLDEVGELPLLLQAKLLRVLEEKEVRPLGSTKGEKIDVRIIAATNRNLENAVAAGIFREDFYYRLNVVEINLPPLRERPEDLPLLIQHFMTRSSHAAQARRIAPDALRILLHYSWPGNVRELENTIERALVLCRAEEISKADLPERLTGSVSHALGLQTSLLRRASLADLEREYILLVSESVF